MADSTVYAALHEAYSEMTNPKKNATNPAFRSKYADLGELLDVTRPILTAAGFVLIQEPVSEDGRIGVHTRLIHKSGESLDFGRYTVDLAKHDAQGAGSALTYTRRYALAAIFGLAQEDDDGNAAKAPTDSERFAVLYADAEKHGTKDAVAAALGDPKGRKAAEAAYCLMTDTQKLALGKVARGEIAAMEVGK